MKIRIYQINMDKDEKRVAFGSLKSFLKLSGRETVDRNIYDIVYEGDVDCDTLEDVYMMFNQHKPLEYAGRSLSVSDVVEIIENGEHIENGFYYCDNIGFEKIEFSEDESKEEKSETMTVIIVKPHEKAIIAEIGTKLKDLQDVVGGYIESIYPFGDPVCLVCNEEGKMRGLEPNWAIYDENGDLFDAIFGTFFICGRSGENFSGLSDEQIQKYIKMFERPEAFEIIDNKIQIIRY